MSDKFPSCPIVKKTFEYDLFKKIEWNRAIDDNNFNKLLKENKKNFQLHKFPIIVTTDYKIIDGQHRFEVSKRLNAPIYFIVDGKDYSFSKVHSVNKAGKKHTLKDKIEMLYKAGDKGAIEVYKIYSQYSCKFDIGVIASILTTGVTGGNVNNLIDNKSKIDLLNYGDGVNILQACTNLNIDDRYSQRVVFSFSKLCKFTKKDPMQVVKQINKNIFLWNDPKTRETAIENLIKCYNYNLKASNKIKGY